MREGLAREFPEAVRALAWTRTRVQERAAMFKREPALWATVSAIGAGFVVSAVTQFAVGLSFFVVRLSYVTSTLTLGWLSPLLGTAAAVAVALRVGGPVSLALYLVYFAVDLAARIPSLIVFCERSGPGNILAYDGCTPLGFIAARWAQWCGIGLGLLLSRMIGARSEGANNSLRVAGAYAVAWTVVLDMWSTSVVRAGPAGALSASFTISVLTVAAAVAAGVVAGTLDRRLRTALIVAVVLVLPWSAQLTFLIPQLATAPPEFAPSMLVGLFSTPVAAVALVLSAAVTDRRRFIPREPA